MSRTKSTRIEPKCTEAELVEALSWLAMEDEAIARVRRILVHGEPPRALAEEGGISPQQVHRQYSKVMAKINELRAAKETPPVTARPDLLIPLGWEAATIVAPPEFIAKVRADLTKLMTAAA